MIIEKCTEGVVVQSYDTEEKKFVGQKFIAASCTWEHLSGRPVDDEEYDYKQLYLPFDMVQPDDS